MTIVYTTFVQVLIMFILTSLGYIITKAGVINIATAKQLAGLLLKIVTPCVIISSFQMDGGSSMIRNLMIAFLLSFLTYFLAMAISAVLIRKKHSENFQIERFAATYSNCGYMGLPLVKAVLGSISDDLGNLGVFYMSAFIVMLHLLSWTLGVSMITGGKTNKESVIKAIFSPGIIGIAIGLPLLLLSVRLPSFIGSPVEMIAKMNTPLAMIIIGAYMTETDIIGALKKIRPYFISFIRLIICPVILIVIMFVFKVDFSLALTATLAASAPSAALTTLFATKFNKDISTASILVTISTLLSIITIPLMVALMQFLFSFI